MSAWKTKVYSASFLGEIKGRLVIVCSSYFEQEKIPEDFSFLPNRLKEVLEQLQLPDSQKIEEALSAKKSPYFKVNFRTV